MNTPLFLAAGGALVAATYLLRVGGVVWGRRMSGGRPDPSEPGATASSGFTPDALRLWLDRATVVVLVSVAATQTVYDGQDITGVSRILGVGVGVLALWRRLPMLLAVLLAMVVTATARLAGLR